MTVSFDDKHLAKSAKVSTEGSFEVREARRQVAITWRLFSRCDTDRRKALKGKSKLWSGYAEVERKWEAKRDERKQDWLNAKAALKVVRKTVYAEKLVAERQRWLTAVRREKDILDPPRLKDWRECEVKPVYEPGLTVGEAQEHALTLTAHARSKKWDRTMWCKIHVGGPDWRAPTPYLATKYRDRAHAWLPSGDYIPARKAAKRHKPRARRDIEPD